MKKRLFQGPLTAPIKVAVEEAPVAVEERERERVFYAIVSPDLLSKPEIAATREHQEQWQMRIEKPQTQTAAESGTMRVRKTTIGDTVCFTQVIKLKNSGSVPGAQDVKETTQEIAEEMFEAFKALSCEGLTKDRYKVPTGAGSCGKPLDVDVFEAQEGQPLWAKIDYEYKTGEPDYPDFQDGFSNIIDGTTEDPQERDQIRKLYDSCFIARR